MHWTLVQQANSFAAAINQHLFTACLLILVHTIIAPLFPFEPVVPGIFHCLRRRLWSFTSRASAPVTST